jgi:hypothetical protein
LYGEHPTFFGNSCELHLVKIRTVMVTYFVDAPRHGMQKSRVFANCLLDPIAPRSGKFWESATSRTYPRAAENVSDCNQIDLKEHSARNNSNFAGPTVV